MVIFVVHFITWKQDEKKEEAGDILQVYAVAGETASSRDASCANGSCTGERSGFFVREWH